ncbi:hypothetical protein DL89DRAFT_260971 [Linderina pennispora]|uniref:Uncharacterized protein n=1 Tax=Linderina pennispora TaxID=61395 RepID=A0A1Y1VWA3_9FUNG|nr:uncharacterized protein DL89DRAFT_260971 [Linderina pennispora]ORX65562.1 hypothetical protein DL89DRAFT_260971 [Linderina pennispora]
MQDSLLNAYIYDFLRKKRLLKTALALAEECGNLPLAQVVPSDPRVPDDTPAGAGAAKAKGKADGDARDGASSKFTPPAHDSASPAKGDGANPADRPKGKPVPAVNVPLDMANTFLGNWFELFHCMAQAYSDRQPAANVPDLMRTYVQHQQMRKGQKPAATQLNPNGKRSGSRERGYPEDPLVCRRAPVLTGARFSPTVYSDDADTAGVGSEQVDAATKRIRSNNGESSPQSAALVAKYTPFPDGSDHQHQQHQEQQQQAATNGVPTIPHGPGVNMLPLGGHMLSNDYTQYLSRSLKVVSEGTQAAGTAHQAHRNEQGNVGSTT